jgi:hypothetical protein
MSFLRVREKYFVDLEHQILNYQLRLHGHWLKIPRNERLCVLCNSKAVADEFHYLFICSDETISQSRLENLGNYSVDRPDNYKLSNYLIVEILL